MEFINPTKDELEQTHNSHLITRENTEQKEFFNKVYDKPWGKEYLAYQNEKIGIWILHIKKDCGTSVHCHFKKDTLLIPLSGSFKIELYDTFKILNELEQMYIPRRAFHGILSYKEESVLMEIEIYTEDVKYTDKNDLLRYRDTYNRKEKSNYASSVVERDPHESEIVNMHTCNNFKIFNTYISTEELTSQTLQNNDITVILDGEVFQTSSKREGSIIDKKTPFSNLSNSVKTLNIKSSYSPEINKVIYSRKHLEDLLNTIDITNIGLTSGCFDIVHSGHIKNLKACKQMCNKLFVCLSSDNQVTRLKGEGRPVNNILDRSILLSHFEFIDYIILYDEENDELESTLDEIMKTCSPKTWFKGKDYNIEDIRKKHSSLQDIILIDLETDKSTTNIINRIQQTNT